MSFNALPYELRSYIWSLAAEPRRITNMRLKKSTEYFRKKHRMKGKDIIHETSATPAPPVMQVCRESRRHAPYQRAFTAGTEPRWTWVNFDLDIFCVTSFYNIAHIISHRSDVQRMRIQTDDDRDWYDSATRSNALHVLWEFPNLRDIQVVLQAHTGGIMWGDVFANWSFGRCHTEKITFVGETIGLVLTGHQIEMAYDWQTLFSFDRDGNPPDPDELSGCIEWATDDAWHLTLAQMQEME